MNALNPLLHQEKLLLHQEKLLLHKQKLSTKLCNFKVNQNIEKLKKAPFKCISALMQISKLSILLKDPEYEKKLKGTACCINNFGVGLRGKQCLKLLKQAKKISSIIEDKESVALQELIESIENEKKNKENVSQELQELQKTINTYSENDFKTEDEGSLYELISTYIQIAFCKKYLYKGGDQEALNRAEYYEKERGENLRKDEIFQLLGEISVLRDKINDNNLFNQLYKQIGNRLLEQYMLDLEDSTSVEDSEL